MPPPHTKQVRDVGLLKRQAPEIGGSVGGFVALVVCLVAVICISLAGIIYLWRDDGRSSVRRNRRATQLSASGNLFASTKLAKILHVGQRPSRDLVPTTNSPETPRSSIKKGTDSLRGWGQASSAEDVFEHTDTDGLRQLSYSYQQSPSPLSFSSPLFGSPSPSPVPFRPPTARVDSSTSVVRFENPQSVTVYHPILSASPQPSIPTITTMPSTPPSPTHAYPRTLSPEPIDGENYQSERQQFAVHSGMPMQTLKRGTKFVESL